MVALVAGGCAADPPWCSPGPWRTEVWSEAPRVEAELRDGCGFPDAQVDHRVRAHGQVVIEGSLEHFDRRRSVERAADGSVEVAVWDRACRVTAAAVTCREVDYRRWQP